MATEGTKAGQSSWKPQTEEFFKHRAQAWEDRQSSSDEFDKNLLTFSSGALGLSLAFIKDIVPLDKSSHLGWLYASWFCFVVCIVATIFSYPLSMKALDRHLVNLEEYYINGNPDYLNPRNPWSHAIDIARMIGGFCFLVGIISTVMFVYINVAGRN